jgi:hypothetical protein
MAEIPAANRMGKRECRFAKGEWDDTGLYETGLASFLHHVKVRASPSTLLKPGLPIGFRIFVSTSNLLCH